MLSIHNVGGGQEAGSYYENADDYYSKDQSPSQWQGKAAAVLGLSGSVGVEDFRQLLDGNLPDGNCIKIVGAGRRGGTDLTFSAPKSLSMQALIGGDKRLIAAHDRAVKRALEYAENLASYRFTQEAETRRIRSGNMAVATFRHELSRSCDPQLHTHCVVLNLTQRADKQWRALDNEPLYRQKKLMGAFYRAELAREVQALGYDIRRSRADGLFELGHLSEEQLKTFSTRSNIIEEALAKRGKDRNDATAQEKKIITIATRPKKTEVDRRELAQYWLEKSDRARIRFEQPKGREPRETLRDGALQALRFAMDHATERQAVVKENKIIEAALEYGVGSAVYWEIKRELKRRVSLGKFIQVNERYTTPQAQERERKILAAERRGRGAFPPLCLKGDTFYRLIDAGLNEGQRDAALLILNTQNRVVGVQGLAGTGKTFMLQAARELAEKEGYQVRGLAPSAAAAGELSKTGIKSETLASFEHSQFQDLNEKTLVVVDEAGMVSARQMQTVLEASEKTRTRVVLVGDTQQLKSVEAGKPFAQLQAHGMVTAGMGEIQRQKNPELKAAVKLASLGKIQESLALMEKEITEIQRHEDRYERIARDFTSLSAQDQESTLIVSGTNAARKAINEEVRKKLGLDGKGFQVEILENKDLTKAETKQIENYSIGDFVKSRRNYRSLGIKYKDLCRVTKLGPGYITLEKPDGGSVNWEPSRHSKFTAYQKQSRELTAGDKIRFTENDRQKELNNGDMAKIKKVEKDQIYLEREDGKQFSLNKSQPLHLDHGYCSTVHSAQGRTCERVLIDADVQSLTSSRDTYYVALSRARREAKIYTNDRERLPEMMARENIKEAALEVGREVTTGIVH